jgi:hypothetical protein
MLGIDSTNKFGSQLFARGYILREKSKPVAPLHWEHGSFRGYYYAHDPQLVRQTATLGAVELLIFGLICDVRRPKDSPATHAQVLVGALARSEDEFFDELSFSCGRYVVVCAGTKGERFVVTDATGMKSALYLAGADRVVASHSALLKENVPGATLRKELSIKFGYPGLRCPVQDAFFLSPNTKLSLTDFSVTRFWPLRPIEKRSLEDATRRVRANMKGVVAFLERHYQPIVAVTAGLDSRVTVSFFRDVKKAQYFSYFRERKVNTDGLDQDFAILFRDTYQRPVTLIEPRKGTRCDPDFSRIQELNAYYEHAKSVAWKYYGLFSSQPKALHVRSNISEVGRDFWRTARFPIRNGEDLARLYLHKRKTGAPEYVSEVTALFEEFAEVTGILQCSDFIDIKSLFYWEFRMASWHSQVVIESDPAFESISIFNCRDTLEALLSVSLEQRKNSLILRNVIKKNWPALTEHPVNGSPFWPQTTVRTPPIQGWEAAKRRFGRTMKKLARALDITDPSNKWLGRAKRRLRPRGGSPERPRPS